MLKLQVKCHEHGEDLICSITDNVLYVDPLSCSGCAEIAKSAGRSQLLREQAEMMGEKVDLTWRERNDVARLACGMTVKAREELFR